MPEHDKLKARKEELGLLAVGEFLEWLQTQYSICEWNESDHEYHPTFHSIGVIMARYADIDLDKIEAEKVALLEEYRKRNNPNDND
jgi:hypothetical protein